MSNNESHAIIVENSIFPCVLYAYFGYTDLEFQEALKKDNLNTDDHTILNLQSLPNNEGRVILKVGDLDAILRMKGIPKDNRDFAFLVHEIEHAVWYMLETVGIYPSDETAEVFGYMTQYITKSILDGIDYKTNGTKEIDVRKKKNNKGII